jgi:hypothetical protein
MTICAKKMAVRIGLVAGALAALHSSHSLAELSYDTYSSSISISTTGTHKTGGAAYALVQGMNVAGIRLPNTASGGVAPAFYFDFVVPHDHEGKSRTEGATIRLSWKSAGANCKTGLRASSIRVTRTGNKGLLGEWSFSGWSSAYRHYYGQYNIPQWSDIPDPISPSLGYSGVASYYTIFRPLISGDNVQIGFYRDLSVNTCTGSLYITGIQVQFGIHPQG